MDSVVTVPDVDDAGVLSARLGPDVSSHPSSSSPQQAERNTAADMSHLVKTCHQCRLRKVRCDSIRPACKNCTKRSEPCEYDPAPKRRGPDKQVRQKRRYEVAPLQTRASVENIGSASGQRELRGLHRTARARPDLNLSTRRDLEDRGATPARVLTVAPPQSRRPTSGDNGAIQDYTTPMAGFESMDVFFRSPVSEMSTVAVTNPIEYATSNFNLFEQSYAPTSMYTRPASGHVIELLNPPTCISRGPSALFLKKTWWDDLLTLYSDDPAQSAVKVFQDLNFLLNNAVHWLSFINRSKFMDNLYDPNARIFIQPSVVLSALALATMMRSSEIGLGGEGRNFALWLRDAAQASLDASISASWMDPSLAQAAFFLALFEAGSHPSHSIVRTSSAISVLDSLIRTLSLTTIDAHEPTVTTFNADEIPHVVLSPNRDAASPPNAAGGTCTCEKIESIPSILNPCRKGKRMMAPSLKAAGSTTLKELPVLEVQWGRGRFKAPWPDASDIAEIEKEESRRLCWGTMMLISALREYTPLEFEHWVWDLHVTKHENFALFFPGETVCKTNPKETVWALHSRAAVLWNCCQRLRWRSDWNSRRTELIGRAWLETNALEDALERHRCPEGHGIPYAGREYILQLKLLISNRFRTSIPLPHSLGHERDSAKEWLIHRVTIGRQVRKLAQFVTRFGPSVASLALAKRPLCIWWAMYQIKAGIQIWRSDPSLFTALEQSLEFIAMVDFMSVMWPSDPQRQYYDQLRYELIECCVAAGVRVPAAVPIPGLPAYMNATMIPSISLIREASASDIPQVSLD